MRILYILNDCSSTGHVPFLVWGGVRGTTGKLQPQNCLQKCIMFSLRHFWGFCSIILAAARIIRSHMDYLLNMCITGCAEFASNQLWVRSRVNSVFFYLLGNRRRLCASRYLLDLRSVIVPISKVSSCDYSNRLDTNSVWKLLVASCAGLWLKFKCTFSTCSPPALSVHLQGKSVHLQCHRYSSPAQHVFAASDKHVRLQCAEE